MLKVVREKDNFQLSSAPAPAGCWDCMDTTSVYFSGLLFDLLKQQYFISTRNLQEHIYKQKKTYFLQNTISKLLE